MTGPLAFIAQGLGPIGQRIVQAACGEGDLLPVAAVDSSPALAGRPLADVVDGAPEGIVVRAGLDEAANDAAGRASFVVDATGSWLEEVAPRLEAALRHGLSVVSTCEELAWPFTRHPDLSRRLDGKARAAGATLVGTGVNPGFLMDQLPVTLRAASHSITSVKVSRVQDPSRRRVTFRAKVGMGLSREAWDREAATGRFGHVGLEESARLLAAGLGWEVPSFRLTLEPVQQSPAGTVLGTLQALEGETADGRRLTLRFEAHSGVTDPHDDIEVAGTPPLRLRFQGGVHGDDATAAAVLRAARVLPAAPRGLVTVLDLPLRARRDAGAL